MARRAIVFAGQGAQAVGMGRELAEARPACAALFRQADEALGYPLSRICFEGPDEELTRSSNCQPGIFVASMACYEALKEEVPGLAFDGAAGLSLGEWTALHLAGALTFEDTLQALEARGRFMQEACEATEGGMVSVMGLPLDTVSALAEENGVEIANVNSREQIVLSGEKAGVRRAEQAAKAAGAKRTVPLNVAGAFHSRLMRPAAERLAETLEGIAVRPPAIPVLSNVTGEPHGDPNSIRRRLVEQVTHTVKWLDCMERFEEDGVESFVECGPGRVLSSLLKRTLSGARIVNIQNAESLGQALEALGSET